MSGDENLEGRVEVTLPTALSMRIASIVSDPALGYVDVQDFVYSAIRRELKKAEGQRFHLGREGAR